VVLHTDLKTQLAKENKEHNLAMTKLHAEHAIVVSDMEEEKVRQMTNLKKEWELEIDELATAGASKVAHLKQQHARDKESTHIEHQRQLVLAEKEWCLGTRCCQEKEQFRIQLKSAQTELNRLRLQVRDMDAAATARHERERKREGERASERETPPSLADIDSAVEKYQHMLQETQDELAALSTMHKTDQHQLDKMTREFDQLTHDRDKVTHQLEQLTQERDKLMYELDHLQRDLSVSAAHTSQLQRELTQSHEAAVRLKELSEIAHAVATPPAAATVTAAASFEPTAVPATAAAATTVHATGGREREVDREKERDKEQENEQEKENCDGEGKEQELERLASELGACKLQLAASRPELQHTTTLLQRATAEAPSAASPDATVADFEKLLDAARDDVETLRKNARENDARLVHRDERIVALERELRDRFASLQALQSAPPVLLCPAATETRSAAGKQEQCANADARLSVLAHELADARQELTDAHAHIVTLQRDLATSQLALVAQQAREASMSTAKDLTAKDLTGKDLTAKDLTEKDLTAKDLTARLEATGRDQEYARAQLKLCQESRDEQCKARELSEETSDERKHALALSREELRVARHSLQDTVSANERLTLLLDSKADYTHKEVKQAMYIHSQFSVQSHLFRSPLRVRTLEVPVPYTPPSAYICVYTYTYIHLYMY